MVLALSNEEEEKVADYLAENGFTVRTAAGTISGTEYGVTGIPAAVLIDPEGTIVWRGHPGSLAKGKVKQALKGARKPGDRELLVFNADLGEEHAAAVAASSALSAAQDLAREGKLGRTLEALDKLAGEAAGDAALLAATQALRTRAEAHVTLLAGQAEAALERLDMLTATRVLEDLSKELGSHAGGQAAARRLADIDKDERLKGELEAALAFERTLKSAGKLSTSNKRKKYEQFAEKYEGTRAAERVRSMLRGLR